MYFSLGFIPFFTAVVPAKVLASRGITVSTTKRGSPQAIDGVIDTSKLQFTKRPVA